MPRQIPPHIQAKIDAYKAARAQKPPQTIAQNNDSVKTINTVHLAPPTTNSAPADKDITLNPEQHRAVMLALNNVSFILTGAAGTGKTTTTKAIAEMLAQRANFPKVMGSTKNFDSGIPGIFFLAFTRAAVRNMRRMLPPNFKNHCFTIHKFVEMTPQDIEKVDEKGNVKTVKIYKPSRNRYNPLPHGINTIVFDESSMISETHYGWIRDALPTSFQEIFIGDINQLPTIADFSIFPAKLTQLPVVELKTIYRQALESPIIRLAHRIKNGNAPTHQEFIDNPQEYKSDELAIYRLPQTITDEDIAVSKYCSLIKQLMQRGQYDPWTDVILVPWKIRFGWQEVNRHIATILDEIAIAENRMTPIYEVISMMRKEYLRVGDKVFYDKNVGIIRSISNNALYVGQPPRPPAFDINRWGVKGGKHTDHDETDIGDLADLLQEDLDRLTRQMSHVITLEMEDGEEEVLSTNQDFAQLSLGYATTIHKAQGSQWPHVILLFHKVHHKNVNREMLYTGITRAEKRLTIICEKDTLQLRAKAQAVKGDTVEEKIEWYKAKLKERDMRKAEEQDDDLLIG